MCKYGEIALLMMSMHVINATVILRSVKYCPIELLCYTCSNPVLTSDRVIYLYKSEV